MAFEANILLLAGLIEIDMPDRLLRICDGGFVKWPARGDFTSNDPEFGTIESVEAIAEAVGDEAPAGRLTLLPRETAAAADLFQSTAQGRPIRFWLAEVNRATAAVIGDPTMLFDGLIDTMTIRIGKSTRKVEVEFIAAAEKLFLIKEGNVLSSRFHNVAWPGERGFDHATGAQTAVPWGVAAPPRGMVGGGTNLGGAAGPVMMSN